MPMNLNSRTPYATTTCSGGGRGDINPWGNLQGFSMGIPENQSDPLGKLLNALCIRWKKTFKFDIKLTEV